MYRPTLHHQLRIYLIALFVLFGCFVSWTYAEISPLVYEKMRQQAEESLLIKVLDVQESPWSFFTKYLKLGSEIGVQIEAEVVEVLRTSSDLKPDDKIVINYSHYCNPPRGLVGPSSIPILTQGHFYRAYLGSSSAEMIYFPAARGESFIDPPMSKEEDNALIEKLAEELTQEPVTFDCDSTLIRSEEMSKLSNPFHCQAIPAEQSTQLCYLQPENAYSQWFLFQNDELWKVSGMNTEFIMSSFTFSPSGRFVAVSSLGEGHPLLQIYAAEHLLDQATVVPLAGWNGYPGWVSDKGWQGENLLLESNVPLDQDYEQGVDYPEEPVYQFRWNSDQLQLERLPVLDKKPTAD